MTEKTIWQPLEDERKEKAAMMVAGGRHTLEAIGRACDVDPRTVTRWKDDADFEERVEEIVERAARRIQKYGIAKMEQRAGVLQEMHEKLLQVVTDRADDPTMAGIPGGPTGLMVRQLKGVGKGEDFQLVETYEVDTGLLRELRGIHERVAKEFGQEIARSEVRADHTIRAREMTDDELTGALREQLITGGITEDAFPDLWSALGVAAQQGIEHPGEGEIE